MPNLVIKTEDGRELQISRGEFVFLKDKEGEVNWEWPYISQLHSEIEKILKNSEEIVDQVKELLPDTPMGRLK